MPLEPSNRPPVVALLGIPNAGKSTLFNRLIGERRALVADIPGTTRDRIYARWRAEGKPCLLCDTGGFAGTGPADMQEEILRQTFTAVEEATVIVLVLDGRIGPTAGDREIAARLRPLADHVVVAWNKADHPALALQATEAFELGLGEAVPVSAEHGLGMADLAHAIGRRLPESVSLETDPRDEIRVAIVGRPNVGKSSLLNRLCGADRVTVAAEPGTTRDAIDTEVIRQGRSYRFVDTAGIRRAGRASRLESLGILMAKRAIERADVVLVVFDAAEGLVSQDLTVAGLAEASVRAAVFVANKWDLVPDKEERIKALEQEIQARLRFARFAPLVTISALGGRRVDSLYALIDRVYKAGDVTISTPRLNRFLVAFRRGTTEGRSGPKLRYLTQTGVRPPSFLAFGPAAGTLHPSEIRRLENRLREEFDIGPTPIRIRFRTDRSPTRPPRRKPRKPRQ